MVNLFAQLRSARIQPLSLLLLFCSFLAVRALLQSGLAPLGVYDEALLFSNAQMMVDGRVPYRDFYSNYPPGIYQIVRLVMATGVEPIWGVRLFCLGVRLGTALAAAWLVGRARRSAPCLATATAVLVLQGELGLVCYAYPVAVLLVMTLISVWPRPAPRRWHRIGCGVLLGCVSYLRHDYVVYAVPQLIAVEGLWWATHKRSFFFESFRELVDFVLGAVGTALLLWVPVFVQAGLMRVAHDIALDQAGRVMASRTLPIPRMFSSVRIDALNLTVPAFIGDRLKLLLTLSALGVGAALYGALKTFRSKTELTSEKRLTVLVAIFSIATLPQALGRTDYWHVAYGVPLMLTAAFSIVDIRVAQLCALLTLLPWFVERPHFITAADASRLWKADDSAFITPERKQVAEFVQRETAPGAPIYVGCGSHRRIIMNPLDIYYVSHRPGATRYMQFDPGLATTAEGQSQMIADLKRTRPRLVLRTGFCYFDEPNLSRLDGSTLLDDYLSANYKRREVVGGFEVWRPRAAPRPAHQSK